MRYIVIYALALGGLWAADRPDLGGTWLLDTASHETGNSHAKVEKLSITQKDSSVQITEAVTEGNGKERKSEFTCSVEGEFCKVKDDGQSAQISFYYNGAMLVMTEMRRGNTYVVKKRIKPSQDGKSLSVEVIHLTPAGQNETYRYTKQGGGRAGRRSVTLSTGDAAGGRRGARNSATIDQPCLVSCFWLSWLSPASCCC